HQENHAADIEEQSFDEIPEDLDEDLKEAPLLDLDYIEEPGVDELEEISPEELENALNVDNITLSDPVKMYLKEIGRVPLLPSDEEVDLAERIAKGDIKA